MAKLNYSRIPKKKHLLNIPKRRLLTYSERDQIKLWKSNRKQYREKYVDKKEANGTIDISKNGCKNSGLGEGIKNP
jgi:hypothetical protein